jgi:UTP--glucose-1-phosphate uridylyltransferase
MAQPLLPAPSVDFDPESFQELWDQLRRGELLESALPKNWLPPQPDEVVPLPRPGTEDHALCLQLGEGALRRGEVASLVVAGGAGTRFGGAVKALVPVRDGLTFLDWKLLDAERVSNRFGPALPVAIMTSRLSHAALEASGARHPFWRNILLFHQRAYPRLTPNCELYRAPDGELSFAPSGHGDFYRAIRQSGVGEQLRQRGVRCICFSNVDNLAATLDPLVIGLHLQLGGEMTVEVTKRARPDGVLDTGAAPVRIDGRLQLVERVNSAQHPLISTNNIAFSLSSVLEKEIPVPFRIARKQVDDRQVLQLEQITAEATTLLDAKGQPLLAVRFIEVPREGKDSRFHPVKAPEDLPAVADWLKLRGAS